MAEELPSLHIDTDWKKQAQEEKRKLVEQAAKAKAAPADTTPVASTGSSAGAAPATGGAPAGKRARGQRELPVPGIPSLVQSMMTQVLYYLGDLAAATGQGQLDLDLAKHHLDTLAALEEKTRNNLTADEQSTLDMALYETRARFITVASQLLGP